MTVINAYAHPNLYFDLGIDLNRLGTVMLDVKPIPGIQDAIDATNAVAYTSPDGEQFWIDGAVGERSAHLTLLHGLLGRETKDLAQRVLQGWHPEPIYISGIEIFPFDGYACVVARVQLEENLIEAHERLSLLPHIDVFPEYKPHVTLAYVSGDDDCIQALAEKLNYLTGSVMQPQQINYGH